MLVGCTNANMIRNVDTRKYFELFNHFLMRSYFLAIEIIKMCYTFYYKDKVYHNNTSLLRVAMDKKKLLI